MPRYYSAVLGQSYSEIFPFLQSKENIMQDKDENERERERK
jgi:hypothetical protein